MNILKTFALFMFVMALCFFIIIFSRAVYSQDAQVGDYGFNHELYHDWYQTGENDHPLMRPDQPKISCCDGDCRPTKGVFRDGKWWAVVDRKLMEIPDSKLKKNVISPDGSAHICSSRRYPNIDVDPTIYCFVPPGGDASLRTNQITLNHHHQHQH